MKGILPLIWFFFFCVSHSMAQSLSGTATTTGATCPANGSITVTASGGTAPYMYSITSGPEQRSAQSSNVFNNLPAGTYTARITDAANAVFNITNINVADNYVDMTPTATATNEICPGSNTGSITLSMPAGQGTAPYTYTIESGPTTAAPATSTATSYTFQNLAPGNYTVRVTDACGAFQSRQATLVAGTPYNLNTNVWARPSGCNSMDYYVQAGLGKNYPQTYYAFKPDGTLAGSITVTAANLVTVPGAGQQAFKFTLPNPPNFQGTYYTFKYTDACVTNVNDSHVIPTTPILGQDQLLTTTGNCQLGLQAKVLEGWKMPVNVTVTSAAGGSAATQQITDEASRSTLFSNLPAGSYTVTFTDGCNHTITETFNQQPQALGSVISYTCGSNIPGTVSIDISGLEQGWQIPVTATITNGPSSYFDAFTNQTYTTSYPVSAQPMINNIIRFANMAPGTYTIVLSDACNTKTVTFTAAPPGAQYNIPRETVTGCAGSRKLTSTSSASCTNGFSADIKKGPAEAVYANGISAVNGFTLSNVPADIYSIYYYSGISNIRTSVFAIPASDIYNGNFLVKKDTITVTDVPTNPHLTGVSVASCTDGTLSIKVIPDPAGSAIVGYEKQNPDGTWGPLQTSPVFSVSSYGTYTFRLTDECGNSGVSSVSVNPNPVPLIKTTGNKCLGSDITLYIDVPANATAVWTKPNGQTVSGAQLYIPNASVADQGNYTVTVTYTIGSCTETKSSTVTLAGCFTLPVNWGMFNAVIKDGTLTVNWSTLLEVNNSYFEVQVSKDGKTWKTIGKVSSTAKDGNSSTEIKYHFNYNNTTDMLAILGLLPLLLLGAGLMKGKRTGYRAILPAFLILLSIGSISYGCKRAKDAIFNKNDEKVFVRVLQYDKDGSQKSSSVIEAVKE